MNMYIFVSYIDRIRWLVRLGCVIFVYLNMFLTTGNPYDIEYSDLIASFPVKSVHHRRHHVISFV